VQRFKKSIVVGLDGLEPGIVEGLLEDGALPNMARLRERGSISRVATTYPAQTPVAWSTFATGLNPGGHGIFDFIRRDPATYLPQLAFSRYQRKNPLVPPKVVNLRRGEPVWERLGAAGLPSTVLRCPCTYPPDQVHGQMLSGMGVPDLRGGLGTSTFYTTSGGAEEENGVVRVRTGADGEIRTALLGPLSPKDRRPVRFEITIHPEPSGGRVVVRSVGTPGEIEIHQGEWSDWLRVKFKTGPLQSIRGMVRFYLVRIEPELELYVSPVNFLPEAPAFPISSPPEYAGRLAEEIGTFYTTGMVEDHDGLKHGHIDEETFLDQCDQVRGQREAMMLHELDRFDEGLFYCLFDTPDRVQHMLWRFREPDHPANRDDWRDGFERAVEDEYQKCDATVGKVLEYADDQTLLIVLSDHGFKTFRRGVNLNTWLYDQGLLALEPGAKPGNGNGDFFHHVDWSRTKAYALGLGGIYLNLRGREQNGIVPTEEAQTIKTELAGALGGLQDPQDGTVAVRSVTPREEVYRGACVEEAPDLVVNFAEGYRGSWSTALGGMGESCFEDNTTRWAGDHIIDPALVPGVLMMNHSFRTEKPRLVDLAPTILDALGAPPSPAMEGEALLP
jgi:predicted AlkP superfamily phosphohydrolase/phosphomutase